MEKILKPDLNKRYDVQKNDLFGRKGFVSKSAQVKEFYFPKKFSAKDFLTGAYGGNKSCWMGDFKFTATDAIVTPGRVIPNAQKQFDTKSMPVNPSSESTKKYGVSEFSAKAATIRGKSQDKFDAQGPDALTGPQPPGWTGAMAPMDIQQVRELLNKSK